LAQANLTQVILVQPVTSRTYLAGAAHLPLMHRLSSVSACFAFMFLANHAGALTIGQHRQTDEPEQMAPEIAPLKRERKRKRKRKRKRERDMKRKRERDMKRKRQRRLQKFTRKRKS